MMIRSDYEAIFYFGKTLLEEKGVRLTERKLLLIPVYVECEPFPIRYIAGNSVKVVDFPSYKIHNLEEEVIKVFGIPENVFILLPPKQHISVWNEIGSKILNGRKNPVILRWCLNFK